MRRINYSAAKTFSHWHIFVCPVFVLSVFFLLNPVIENDPPSGKSCSATIYETIWQSSGFELPDEAIFRTRQKRSYRSDFSKNFKITLLPEYLKKNLLPVSIFSLNITPFLTTTGFAVSNPHRPATPVRAGPQNA